MNYYCYAGIILWKMLRKLQDGTIVMSKVAMCRFLCAHKNLDCNVCV